MQEPMLWNTLDDAASWLTEATGQVYTARNVLNLGLTTYRDQFTKSPPTCLKAAPPRDTKFGMYRWDVKQGTPSNPMVRQHEMNWQPIPLYRHHLSELQACGETLVSIAKRPDDWDGQANQYVLIEPLDKSFKVDLSMVGITGRDLMQLASIIRSETPAVGSTETPASVVEKKEASTAGWEAKAREAADELYDRDTKNGVRDSLRGYARRVMELRKVSGPRGIIDNANTIQREALQGEKWWAKKSKT